MALPVVVGLLAASALLLAFTQRNLFSDELASMNDYSAAQAHEAAEAGLAWATAVLNVAGASFDACPTDTPSSVSRRGFVDLSSPIVPGHTPPWGRMLNRRLDLSCSAGEGDAWQCRCLAQSNSGAPGTHPGSTRSGVGAGGQGVSVQVTLQPGMRPGTIHLHARGCSASVAECSASTPVAASGHPAPAAPSSARTPTAHDRGPTATAQADLGETLMLVPAMQSVPDGPLTWIDTSTSSSDAAFVSQFGLPRHVYRGMPVVHRIRCNLACPDSLRLALDAGWRIVWIDGDLRIDEPLDLAAATGGAILIIDGALRVNASLVFQGLIHARAVDFTPRASYSRIRGAVLAERVAPDHWPAGLQHDPAVLEHVQVTTGPFVGVPGSWHVP